MHTLEIHAWNAGMSPSRLTGDDDRAIAADQQKNHRLANAANAHTAKGTARLPCCGALDGMKPGSCEYRGPLPDGVPPISMYAAGGGGQYDTPG